MEASASFPYRALARRKWALSPTFTRSVRGSKIRQQIEDLISYFFLAIFEV